MGKPDLQAESIESLLNRLRHELGASTDPESLGTFIEIRWACEFETFTHEGFDLVWNVYLPNVQTYIRYTDGFRPAKNRTGRVFTGKTLRSTIIKALAHLITLKRMELPLYPTNSE